MIPTKEIVHFTIPVSNLEKSLEFYSGILGMTVIRAYKHMAFLRSGEDERITILGQTDAIHPDTGKETHVHHAWAVDSADYQKSMDFVRSKGIEIIFEEDRESPATIAGPRFYIHDPDRNVIEIIDWTNKGEF